MAILNAGSGADGNATVTGSININTDSLVGGGYADMVSYSCTSVGSNGCVTNATPNGIVVGDEVLLINLQGITGDYGNTGNYETFEVGDVSGSTITFTTAKTKNYGNGSGDTNIGTLTSNQRVMVQRVPQYANLTIDNGQTLSCSIFNKQKGGVLFFRASGTTTNNGTISAAESGQEGGYTNGGTGGSGEKGDGQIVSPGTGTANNLGGGGGGVTSHNYGYGGAGGGYGTAGVNSSSATGGIVYGETTMSGIYLGSGGGGGGHSDYGSGRANGPGGFGGGSIGIFVGVLHNYGVIDCDGADGGVCNYCGENTVGAAGGGSGGSILIHAGTIWYHSSTTIADGGLGTLHTYTGSIGNGTDGGDGRIAIYYSQAGDSQTGISPTPYTDGTLQLPYKIQGTSSEAAEIRVYDTSWVFAKTSTVGTGAYEISNLPDAGPFHVIGMPTSSGSCGLIYRDVVPIN